MPDTKVAKLEKPQRKFSYVTKRMGHYNLCDISQERAQYCFYLRDDAPKLDRRGFTIDIEKDPNIELDQMALDVAQELLDFMETAFISNSQKAPLREMITYLESVEEQDREDYLHYNVDLATWKMVAAETDLELWKHRLDRWQAHPQTAGESNK